MPPITQKKPDPNAPIVPPPVMPSLAVPGSSHTFDTWLQSGGADAVPLPVQPGTPILPQPPLYAQMPTHGSGATAPDMAPPDIGGGTSLAGPPAPQANMPHLGIQNQGEYFASHPDQQAAPILQGHPWKSLFAGLAAGAMGWGGNPSGENWLSGLQQHDRNIPEINAQRYESGYLKPTMETYPVQLPDGTTLPAGMAKTVLGPLYGYQGKIGAANINADAKTTAADTAAGAKVQAAQIGARFKVTPTGLVDTQTQTVVPGTAAGITITPEIAADYNLPQEYIGKPMKLSDLAAQQRNQIAAAPTVGSSTDSLGVTTTSSHQKVLPGGARQAAPAGGSAPAFGGPPKATAPGSAKSGGGILDRQAEQLVEGNMDPSQVPKRGAAYQILLDKANAISQQKYGKPFDIAQSSTDYKFANEAATQNTLKYLNSLTGPDNKSGNLGALVDMSNKLGRTQFPAINNAQAWARIQSGDPQMASYRAAATEVADQVGKILQGGGSGSGTSDAKLKQATELFSTGFSADQMASVAGTLRTLLANRKGELVGGNRYLQKQFGASTPAPQGGTPSGATHKAMGSDKKWHYTNDQGEDLGVVQ